MFIRLNFFLFAIKKENNEIVYAGVSMMERLMTLDCYTNDRIKKSYTTKLIKNFRCHNAILKVPNELFYDGELQCKGGLATLKGMNWKYLPNKKFPIILHAVDGDEKRDDKNPR